MRQFRPSIQRINKKVEMTESKISISKLIQSVIKTEKYMEETKPWQILNNTRINSIP
jgi:methionyl-tRNA synthetase